jgi:hypothetical protein
MTDEITEDFADLKSWDLLVESRQYRAGGISRINLREVIDFAFLDLIGLFILHNEYETAPVASLYSAKTMSFRNFLRPRLSGTDLYVSMNILFNADSIFSKSIEANPEADAIQRAKISPNLPTIKRYLSLIETNKITGPDAAVLLLRIEKQLNITNTTLKSIRRLAQEWPTLTKMQRELVVTRMLQFYKRFARRSEIAEFLSDMSAQQGYETRGPVDAELANLGMGGEKVGGILQAIAPLAAFYAGYKLFGPKEDK